MPELALKCIESWHKYMPNYEYKLWNEDNFDINSIPYVKEAYEARKFAFVTDYVRLHALYTEGGIYMDTDVEVLKPYDDLLNLPGFTGYEGSKYLPPVTGTLASEAGNLWVKEQLESYVDAHFFKPDGTLDTKTNTIRISEIMRKGGFVQNGEKQVYKNMHIFPVEYFCPRQTTGEVLITENTYCDHHFMGSWSVSTKKSFLRTIIGHQTLVRLIKIKRMLFG
ncbi:MAG: glycosyl transferase [Butyrivibrio sp.]|nr:glycosyl transferase [Butyrivibrio sp.]